MDATRVCLLALDLFNSPGWSASQEIHRLYALSNRGERHYRRITLSKRDGGERLVLAPDYWLKTVQRSILTQVLSCFPVSPFATAYRPGSTVVDNASPHRQQPQLLKLDIENFFDNISWYQVWHLFRQTTLPSGVIVMLTHLCCYREALPQGAPTSPTISNLVMRHFDEQLGAWCQARGIIYTRYCDDMTFSGDFDAREVKDKVTALLAKMGMRLNKRKTALVCACQQQRVTGIVVNETLQLSREQRRTLRQEVYFCQKYGVIAHLSRRGNLDSSADPAEQARHYLHSLQGKIGWLLQVNPQDKAFVQARRDIRQLLSELHHG